jgi:hypothetical protein
VTVKHVVGAVGAALSITSIAACAPGLPSRSSTDPFAAREDEETHAPHAPDEDSASDERERAAREAALGPMIAVEVPKDLSAPYELLMSAARSVVFGSHCGYLGIDPPGKDAMTRLVAARRWDLVGNVLRGPNAGGRLYAATAIIERAGAKIGRDEVEAIRALSPEDARTLLALARDTTSVDTCSGCTSSISSSAKLLEVVPSWPRSP